MSDPITNLSSIRERVLAAFRESGVGPEKTIRETVLIQAGHYVGRRFQTKELYAIWIAGEDDFTLHRDETVLAGIVRDAGETNQPRKAA